MTLIHKLGLVGLIGIVILIVIYLIKPNYQQKTVSSTYIWKLSLKYKKKRLPTSKIRNILLFLCQALALTCLVAVLVKPAIVLKQFNDEEEIVVIIDASASMRTKSEETDTIRFDRALTAAKDRVQDVLNKGGVVSLILAKSTPEYLYKRATGEVASGVIEALDDLSAEDCGYSGADLDEALAASEEILAQNPSAGVYVYTDADYDYIPAGVNVCNVAEEGEWNAAILSAEAAWDEGYYSFIVKVACYGKTDRINVVMDVYGVNGFGFSSGSTLTFSTEADCDDGVTETLIFKYRKDGETDVAAENQQIIDLGKNSGEKISSYSSVHISLVVEDSYDADDNFDIYGGQKQILRVQYASSEPNPFVNAALENLKADYADRWDIRITEVKKGEPSATQGYDLYIFEHAMPATMPTDGVVYLFDPETAPHGCGFRVDGAMSVSKTAGKWPSLYGDKEHRIVQHVEADNITISRYQAVSSYDANYTVLMSWNKNPMLMVRDDMLNEGGMQALVMNFSFMYSNLGVLPEVYFLMQNAFEYFFPATVEKNVFEVNEKAALTARSNKLTVSSGGWDAPVEFTSFPSVLTLSAPGTYTLTQINYYGKQVTENIYVKLPAAESNVTEVRATLYQPERETEEENYLKDIVVYIAAALVFFIFAEWALQQRDGI